MVRHGGSNPKPSGQGCQTPLPCCVTSVYSSQPRILLKDTKVTKLGSGHRGSNPQPSALGCQAQCPCCAAVLTSWRRGLSSRWSPWLPGGHSVWCPPAGSSSPCCSTATPGYALAAGTNTRTTHQDKQNTVMLSAVMVISLMALGAELTESQIWFSLFVCANVFI